MPLSINLSAHDLHDPDLICRVRGLLAEWSVEQRMVQFALTERAVMEDAIGALATLSALKEGGASLSIDDFGTGYSSLSYLHKRPVDGIKIGQSFIIPTPPPGQMALSPPNHHRDLNSLVWNIYTDDLPIKSHADIIGDHFLESVRELNDDTGLRW